MLDIGIQRIIGLQDVRQRLSQIVESDKMSHAYLFTGSEGIGKKAIALAMAEAVNGIQNLSTLPENSTKSNKSSWRKHPDIHFYFPITTDVADSPNDIEITGRLDLLAEDPYAIIDFERRPSLKSAIETSNKQSFYPISYFRNVIKKSCLYKPNEGKKTVVIITRIERMRKESANAFLKLLEEPPPQVLFLLTCDYPEQLLPTITSRCQTIHFRPLTVPEIKSGLMQFEGLKENEAETLAKMANGNYTITRFYDIEALASAHEEVINFLRLSYSQHAFELTNIINKWHKLLSLENQVALLSLIEATLRDIYLIKYTNKSTHINNVDQRLALEKFIKNLPNAKIELMIEELAPARTFIKQNGNFKMLFTVLSMRYAKYMRGLDPIISAEQNYLHQPAFQSH